jgi:uncharacterized protein (TIGR03437 family)
MSHRFYHAGLAILFLTASGLAQTPVIGFGGILNGASFRFPGAPGGGVAPGTIISIFGTNLATAASAATSVPLLKNLNGTSVTIGGIAAPLFFVSAGQINAQVPWSTPSGSQAVVVTLNGASSAVSSLTVQTASPGIFSQISNGKGPGAIQNYVSSTSTPLNNVVTAIAPGGIVIIYATGLGPVSNPPADGAIGAGQTTMNAVTVKIGTTTVTPQFAGLAPGYVGLYQVNAQLPSTLTQGCSVSVQLSVAGQVSNTVTLSVAGGGNCTTLASEFMPAPNSNFGTINLVRGALTFPGSGTQSYNTMSAAFMKFGPAATPPLIAPPAGGGCLTDFFPNTSGLSTFPTFTGGVAGALDAGVLTYTPAGSSPVTLTAAGGVYQTQIAAVNSGTHTMKGAGGTNVAAFTSSFNVPSQFNGQTNVSGSTFSQASGFTATWSACPDPNGEVIVGAFALDARNTFQGTVFCAASCSAGSFKVGSDLLNQLPLGNSGGAGVFLAFIGVPVKFTATGIDAGYFTFLDFLSLESLTMTQ